jgi:hypothetical protein
MAKKQQTSKKVKQVAGRAKRTPRTETNAPGGEAYYTDQHTGRVATKPSELAPNTTVWVAPDGDRVEFSTEKPEETKKNAIARAKKVDLKGDIRSIVEAFSKDIDERLKALSDQIEGQMQPLVRSVADIAVAKKELADKLADFEDRLSATLNLNDELEPIDISEIFGGQSATGLPTDPDAEDFHYEGEEDPEEAELLAEVADDVRQDGHAKPVN